MKKLFYTGLVFVIFTMMGFFISRLSSIAPVANWIELIFKNLSFIVMAFLINFGALRFINAKKPRARRIISSDGLIAVNLMAVIVFLMLAVLTYVLMVRNGSYNSTEIFRASSVFTSVSSYFLGSLFGVSFFKRKIETLSQF